MCPQHQLSSPDNTLHPGVSHLQGKDGGDWFVVADSVFHVTSVAVLRHFGPAGQP